LNCETREILPVDFGRFQSVERQNFLPGDAGSAIVFSKLMEIDGEGEMRKVLLLLAAGSAISDSRFARKSIGERKLRNTSYPTCHLS
jgi:hypothetical protein